MSSKKTNVIWFRFKFTDNVKTRAAVIRAADKLFNLSGVIERRNYTEEEVADMMKRALQEAEAARHVCRNCKHHEAEDYMMFCKKKNGEFVGNESEDGLGEDCEEFERDEDKSSTAAVRSASLADEEEQSRTCRNCKHSKRIGLTPDNVLVVYCKLDKAARNADHPACKKFANRANKTNTAGGRNQ